ncbi:MAG: DUF1735 domain-containing protein, partial [Bacteroidetes bacterium]|nr:DUF1735 domain-containing protein [Bacteroidota bacterium]
MKIASNIFPVFTALLLSAAVLPGCKKNKSFGDAVILATGTELSPIVKFSVEGTPASYSVTATATEKATENIKVTFALDTSAVLAYNKEHNTSYFVVPSSAISLSDLNTVINAGSSTSTPATVKVVSTSPLVDGRSYLIPLTITTVSGGH